MDAAFGPADDGGMVPTAATPVRYAVVGGAWRAEFFLDAARTMPERFAVTGVLVRDAGKAAVLERRWGVPSPRTLDALLAAGPQFVVLSVPPAAAAEYVSRLAARNVPVLTETPPAGTADEMLRLWDAVGPLIARGAKVQVAEQYPFQPMHAARVALARSGRLGPVGPGAGVGVARLPRRRADPPAAGRRPGAGPRRGPAVRVARHRRPDPGGGPPTEEKRVEVTQTVATLAFDNGQVGVFDFTVDQHRNWARFNRVSVRGERGEVQNDAVPVSGRFPHADPSYAAPRRHRPRRQHGRLRAPRRAAGRRVALPQPVRSRPAQRRGDRRRHLSRPHGRPRRRRRRLLRLGRRACTTTTSACSCATRRRRTAHWPCRRGRGWCDRAAPRCPSNELFSSFITHEIFTSVATGVFAPD